MRTLVLLAAFVACCAAFTPVPAPEGAIPCSATQTWTECGKTDKCEASCAGPETTEGSCAMTMCIGKCVCIPGFVKANPYGDMTCIPADSCPLAALAPGGAPPPLLPPSPPALPGEATPTADIVAASVAAPVAAPVATPVATPVDPIATPTDPDAPPPPKKKPAQGKKLPKKLLSAMHSFLASKFCHPRESVKKCMVRLLKAFAAAQKSARY